MIKYAKDLQGSLDATTEDVAKAIVDNYGSEKDDLIRMIAEALHLTLRNESICWFYKEEYDKLGKELGVE